MGAPREIIREKDHRTKSAGRNKATGGDSGTTKKRSELPKGWREAALVVTRDNQMVLVLDGPHLKRRWVRAIDLK